MPVRDSHVPDDVRRRYRHDHSRALDERADRYTSNSAVEIIARLTVIDIHRMERGCRGMTNAW